MQFLVAGHVAMTPEEREAWRTGALDPTPWQWLEDIPMFDGTAPPPMATAGRWLEEVADPERGGVSFVVDVPTRKGVVFMGLVDDEDLERWHQDLATVFLMAGRHNGKGEVAIFSAEAGVCFHIDIGPKGSVSLPDQDAFAGLFERQQQRFVVLQQLAAARARVDGLDVRRFIAREVT